LSKCARLLDTVLDAAEEILFELDGLILGIMCKLGVAGYSFRVYDDNYIIMLDSLKKVKFSDPVNAARDVFLVRLYLCCFS
jgi:hypothetical protein